MLTYTTALQGRDMDTLQLTDKEASELLAAGFRFSVFDPSTRNYRLSAPYKLLQHIERGTLTVMQ